MEFYKSTHLLTGSEDHTVCIWRVHDWALLHVLGGHKAAVTSLRCVCVSVCLRVCLCVYLCICVSVCGFVCGCNHMGGVYYYIRCVCTL